MPLKRNIKAFTLIELIISVAIFAVMATAAYSGLSQILIVKDNYQAHSEFTNQIQKTFLQLQKDIIYISNTNNRNQYGETESSFKHNNDSNHLFRFTSANKQNPLQLKQHPLVKLNYYIEDEKLIRAYDNHFNSPPDSTTKRRALLNDIEQVEVRFMDDKKQWKEQWPPLNLTVDASKQTPSLPTAIETTLHIKQHGKFTWLFAP